MKTTEFNEEVLFTLDTITEVNINDIELLKTKAVENTRRRIRLCAHLSVEDTLHEMLIVHTKGTYVRPHKHLNKTESFHIIEGGLKVVVFDDDGEVTKIITMSDYSSGSTFYYRLSESLYHTVIPTTDYVVFHETTHGPFNRQDTLFAPWSPDEYDQQAAMIYLQKLYAILGKIEE